MSKKNTYLRQRRGRNRRFLLVVLAIIILAFSSMWFYNKKYESQMVKLDEEIKSSSKKKEDLDLSIKTLREDYKNRNTDEFKEKIARDRLNMVKKSEVVYEDENN
ncbi:MAG: septum formation initiator family protein [Anaerococcus sp.]|nr:septum formation initiator family protein [Anaerococcus sp.]